MVNRDSDLLERDEGLPLPLSLFKLIYFSYSEMLEQNHGLSKVFSSHATLKTDGVHKELNFFYCCFPCRSLPGGLYYPDNPPNLGDGVFAKRAV